MAKGLKVLYQPQCLQPTFLEQDVATPHLLKHVSQFTEIRIKVIHIIAILHNALPSYETHSQTYFLFVSDGEDIPNIKSSVLRICRG